VADYHKKPLLTARVPRESLDWARDEAERRDLPFGDFVDGLITAGRDHAAELADRTRQLDLCRDGYRVLLGEVIAGLATAEHVKVVKGGLPFCRCGFSLADGKASESFVTHALAVLAAQREANHVANHTPVLAAKDEQPRKAGKSCSHRLPSGAWCKTCEAVKP
jgi:hypothetical protein